MYLNYRNALFCVLIISSSLVSCLSSKKATEQAIYFKKLNDSSLLAASIQYEPVFQKGDMLNITVSTANESSRKLLNPVQGTQQEGNSSDGGGIYLVGIDGTITMPLIGIVKVEGLTKSKVVNDLTEKIRQLVVSDAIVSIRLQNYKVTVLGEVAKPSSYTIPNERVTVLDAIGLAGDLTAFGRRDNIKIIREDGNKREMGTLNLNDGNIFQSPYYYLRQNDVVYVEMNDKKMRNADQSNIRTFSIIIGVVSAIGVILSTITRF